MDILVIFGKFKFLFVLFSFIYLFKICVDLEKIFMGGLRDNLVF